MAFPRSWFLFFVRTLLARPICLSHYYANAAAAGDDRHLPCYIMPCRQVFSAGGDPPRSFGLRATTRKRFVVRVRGDPFAPAKELLTARRKPFTVIDFQFNYPLLGTEAALIAAALHRHGAEPSARQPETNFAGTAKHREVAASYLSRKDFSVPAGCVFLCAGGHAAIAIAFASAALEGSAVAVDELTLSLIHI